MQYRALPHGGEKVSIIGLGMGSIHRASVEETERTVRTAIDAGINYLDFIPSEAVAFEGYARALRGQREKVMLQVHLGASYSTGTYGFTTDPKVARREFEARLRSLDTDYADFGFIHCIDARAVHPVCARPTSRVLETRWRRSIIAIWKPPLPPASRAVTATAAVLSACTKAPACRKSPRISIREAQ